MSKKIIISIVVIAAIIGGVWVFMRNNYSPSDQSYGSDQGTAPTPQANQQTGQDAATPPAASATNTAVKEFTITGQNYSFTPAAIAVKKGDMVKITFRNADGTHDLKIDEFSAATKRTTSGEEDTISFVADKTGSFEYYCSIGSHRQAGMKGTLVVTE